MKFVTYNIQYSKGGDGRFDIDRVVASVRGADVIALQEVERFWERSGNQDQPAEIARRLPDYYRVYHPAFDVYHESHGLPKNAAPRRQFGCMLLSRTPILACRRHTFPKLEAVNEFNMLLGAVEGVIQTREMPLRIYSLQLSSVSLRERKLQVQALLDIHRQALFEGGACSGPALVRGKTDWSNGNGMVPMPAEAVLLGDFNLQPGSPEYDAIVGPEDPVCGRPPFADGFVDAWDVAGSAGDRGATYPANADYPENLRIDYGFFSGRLVSHIRKTWVDRTAEGSDHLPLWIETDM